MAPSRIWTELWEIPGLDLVYHPALYPEHASDTAGRWEAIELPLVTRREYIMSQLSDAPEKDKIEARLEQQINLLVGENSQRWYTHQPFTAQRWYASLLSTISSRLDKIMQHDGPVLAMLFLVSALLSTSVQA